ncbi:FtsK/SpoIIIE domain-containing protein [Peribacillus frigoritolerans]|uniref:FtsK/SpoIIIE domain-containing protein n=1 Tax=Peribacillus frigoritolerans TaxID=450367 RepID=UPI002E1F4240|nr:FtsK/SpoIIIE domain-containing protein [Peribacillus frigoritolerans]MED4693765.1 FtsK/SpoIIIE domain-containing protein [Peribacillus frigoritolerans]
MKLRGSLMRAFKLGGIHKQTTTQSKTYTRYPKIHEVHIDEENDAVRFTFTLPDGANPDLVLKQEWVFKQCFGNNIEIDGKVKKFILWCYSKEMEKDIPFEFKKIQSHLKGKIIPIMCGVDRSGKMNVKDMAEEHHMLLTGTTGSGKSSLIRGILTSLILHKSPDEIQFLLGDLKFSEFGIYKRLPHVMGVYMDAKSLLPPLQIIEKEMFRRGKLLDKMDVESIYELKDMPPTIVVCIDEVILLKGKTKHMDILERISCVGRSNGVYLLLSMQRGDAKSLGGQLKNNLTFRMSGKQSDEMNAKISGLKQSVDLDTAGRMILSTQGKERVIQVPYMDKKKAKELLDPLKLKQEKQELEDVADRKVNEFSLDEVFDSEPKG